MNFQETAFLKGLIEASWQSSLIILLILLIRPLLGMRIPARWRYLLWMLVIVRLLVPAFVLPPSPASLQNIAVVDRPFEQLNLTFNSADDFKPIPQSLEEQAPAEVVSAVPAVLAPAAPSQPPVQSLSWWRITAMVWLAGTALVALWILAETMSLLRQLRRDSLDVDEAIQNVWAECCAKAALRRPLRIIATKCVESPALLGLFRPVLLIPKYAMQTFSSEDWRHVFMHELAHYKRRDHWTQALQLVALCAHWFNPLVWVGFRYLRADRELAADEWALGKLKEADGTAYGDTLLKVLSSQVQRPIGPCMIGIMEDASQLKRRLKHIVAFGPYKWISSMVGVVTLLLFAAVVVGRQPNKPTPLITAVPENIFPKEESVIAESNRMTKSGSIKGEVVSTEGKPLANAMVILIEGPREGSAFIAEGSTKTDAEGNFRFEPGLDVPAVREFFVIVQAEGFGMNAIPIRAVDKNDFLKVELGKPVEVTVKLVNEAGEPLPNVRLKPAMLFLLASKTEEFRYLNFPPALAEIYAQTSDSNGICVFKIFPKKSSFVLTHGEEFAHLEWNENMEVNDEPLNRIITLIPGASISGKVTTKADGKPASGIPVKVQRIGEVGEGAGTTVTFTDENGVYEVSHLRSSTYIVSLGLENSPRKNLQDEFTAVAHKPLSLGKGEKIKNIDLEMIPGVLIIGRLTAEDSGEPIPNTAVRVSGPAHPDGGLSSKTDSNGNYRLRVPPGKQRLHVYPTTSEFAPDPDRKIEVKEGDKPTVDFKLKRMDTAATKEATRAEAGSDTLESLAVKAGLLKPHQIEIQSKYYELTNEAADLELAFLDKLPGKPKQAPGSSIRAVLNEKEADQLLSSLKRGDLASAPRVTTKSGSRATIEIIREFRYATAWNPPNENEKRWTAKEFETKNCGITLEVEPTVTKEGIISLKAEPSLVEFLGFVDTETRKPALSVTADGTKTAEERALVDVNLPNLPNHPVKPVFSILKTNVDMLMNSGQTLVLDSLRESEQIEPFKPARPGYRVVVFIKATIVETEKTSGNASPTK